MTSAELSAAKGQLISNVETYISEFSGLSSKLSTISSDLSGSNDTVMSNELAQGCTNLDNIINNAVKSVQSQLSQACAQIDAEIRRLQEIERQQQLAKLRKKKLENEDTE